MKRQPVKAEHPDARERLLHIGLAAFARHGYEGATIRSICKKAQSNLAAIKYYFGDKNGYYQAVHNFACQILQEQFRQLQEESSDLEPWPMLHKHIDATLKNSYDNLSFLATWLQLRELMDDGMVGMIHSDAEECRRRDQFHEQLNTLLSQLLGPAATTPRNLMLLRYTYFSMTLFLSIQSHIEECAQFPAELPRLKNTITADELSQYIYTTMEKNVLQMQQEAAAAATPSSTAGDLLSEISPA